MFNFKNFTYISRLILPYISWLCVIFFTIGTYLIFFWSPIDYKQGELVRIMYIHVPSAWIALGAYVLIAIFSISVLIWNNIISSIIAQSLANIGAVFTLICLITGSIWGKGTWGSWWVWDARLTSMLILFFLYIGYLILCNLFENDLRSMKTAAIFAIFSVINIPIIKLSVNIWRTLHQPSSIFRKGGIAIDHSMMIPLIIMFIALSLLSLILIILKAHTLLNLRKIKILTISKFN